METGMATKSPKMSTMPKSASKIAAAANGPGVGGTNTWAEYKPVAKAMANTRAGIPVFLLMALFKEESMMYPESQYTGMEITNPARLIAKGERFNPITFKILLAKTWVLPVFSK